MTRGDFDIEDFANYFVYFFFSFISFEWMQPHLGVLGNLNYSFGTFQAPMQEITVTFPRLVLVLSLTYLLWTNDLDLSAYSFTQIFIVGSMVWMIVSPPFVPFMYFLVQDVAIASIGAFAIQSLGWGIVMKMG